MKPKITRTVKVAMDVKLTPDNLQQALDRLWEQDAPGDAGLSLLITGTRFTATASWDVLAAPAMPDETEAQEAERIPLEDVKITGSTEDSVTIMATLPEKLGHLFRDTSEHFSINVPEPDREAIAAQLRHAWASGAWQ